MKTRVYDPKLFVCQGAKLVSGRFAIVLSAGQHGQVQKLSAYRYYFGWAAETNHDIIHV